MPNTTKLYLVRHGESEANRSNLVGGHLDAPLTDTGRAQAQQAKASLQDVHFDTVYSSDLQRAVETAGIIYGQSVPTDHQLSDLRERNFGRLEGTPSDEWFTINDTYEQQYSKLPIDERLNHEYADFIEGDKALYSRFNAALLKIANENTGKTVLVTAHAGPIRVMLMKLGFADFLKPGSFDNAGYVELGYDGHAFQIEKAVGLHK